MGQQAYEYGMPTAGVQPAAPPSAPAVLELPLVADAVPLVMGLVVVDAPPLP
jgi:hypothetical protein